MFLQYLLGNVALQRRKSEAVSLIVTKKESDEAIAKAANAIVENQGAANCGNLVGWRLNGHRNRGQ